MTALVATDGFSPFTRPLTGHLVPVVYKRNRVASDMPNDRAILAFHTFKCFGQVLNPDAVHGRGYVTRRVVGQDIGRVMRQLKDIAERKPECV